MTTSIATIGKLPATMMSVFDNDKQHCIGFVVYNHSGFEAFAGDESIGVFSTEVQAVCTLWRRAHHQTTEGGEAT
jgi:hypothetical protein